MTDLCPHRRAEPVVLITGETVASVCTDCHHRLPASWGCPDCEYAEITSMVALGHTRYMTHLCDRHA